MGRKMLAIMCIVGVSLAASVTATPRYQSDNPLYTIRMEQACSNMHFLPPVVNEIIYTTTKGYTINYDIPEVKGNDTASPIWDTTYMYTWCYTCWDTCWYTCSPTCWPFCWWEW